MENTFEINYKPSAVACRGFTMLELAIAILVFCIGFVGMNRMQAMAIRGNAFNKQLTEATSVMKSTSERLIGLAQDNNSLGGALPITGTLSISSPDVSIYRGYIYSPSWSVSQMAGMNLKQVIVSVRWTDFGVEHSVSDTFCK
jgi:prepilin-type N-terminal cleavage/methylation domain-containing protein